MDHTSHHRGHEDDEGRLGSHDERRAHDAGPPTDAFETFAALCTDFYVNQKLALKMDLPTNRETLLDLFQRIKRDLPGMDRFRRFDDELALESPGEHAEYSWMALRPTSIRSGWVNPPALERAYRLHQLILDVSPFFLSISPLDVEYLELVFGFDVQAHGNRSAIVFEALLADSPLGQLVRPGFEEVFDAQAHGNRSAIVFEALLADSPLGQLVRPGFEEVFDAQPSLGFALDLDTGLQAFVEIKARSRPGEHELEVAEVEPISVYLTVRQPGPITRLEELRTVFGRLAGTAERLSDERVIPHVVAPIRQAALGRPG